MATYELPELPYDYDALEPIIDQRIMELHHDKHHQGYVDGANAALDKLEEMRGSGDWGDVRSVKRSLAFNLSGHVNHTVFWQNMHPDGGGEPEGELLDAIEENFGSYEGWKGEFEAAASAASGWALLVYDPVAKQLRNLAVDRHNDGALWGAHPILALDVWEHSYYYDYGPDRGSFVDAFFEVVDWDYVAENYRTAIEQYE